jgi:hypothetical protein
MVAGVRLTSLPSVSRMLTENVGALTSHKSMVLHGLVQEYLYLLTLPYIIFIIL